MRRWGPVSLPPSRRDRRSFRRTSPDAPQGIVPVAVVMAAYVSLIVVLALSLGFPWTKSSSEKAASTAGSKKTANVLKPELRATTTLIIGATTLFVTTTTPITTTTSTSTTTTTTLLSAADQLSVNPLTVTFNAQFDDVVLTVSSLSAEPVTFTLAGTPQGVAASPTTAEVSFGKPVTLTLSIPDPSQAKSGSLVVTGGDNLRITIGVTVPSSTLTITGLSLDTNTPACNTPVRMRVTVGGGPATAVVARLQVRGSTSTVPLSAVDSVRWQADLPGMAAGTQVTGTAVATNSNQSSDPIPFSYRVGGGPSC